MEPVRGTKGPPVKVEPVRENNGPAVEVPPNRDLTGLPVDGCDSWENYSRSNEFGFYLPFTDRGDEPE